MERLLSFPFRSPRRRLITRIERESCSQRTVRPVVPLENVVRCWVMVYDCLLHDIWGGSLVHLEHLPFLAWTLMEKDADGMRLANASLLLPDLIFHFSRRSPPFDWRSRALTLKSREGRLHGGQTKASGRETLPFREFTMHREEEIKKKTEKKIWRKIWRVDMIF